MTYAVDRLECSRVLLKVLLRSPVSAAIRHSSKRDQNSTLHGSAAFSYGVILKTTPDPFAPPWFVVPYRFPFVSKTKLLKEYRPSLPPVKT